MPDKRVLPPNSALQLADNGYCQTMVNTTDHVVNMHALLTNNYV